jgi:thiaminase
MEKIWEDLDIKVEDIEHSKFSDYLKQRDLAVQSIGVKKGKAENKLMWELRALKKKIASIDLKTVKTKEDLAKAMGISSRNMYKWLKNPENDDFDDDLGKNN